MAHALFSLEGYCAAALSLRYCPVPLTVRGTQALVSFAPLAFKLFCAAREAAPARPRGSPRLPGIPTGSGNSRDIPGIPDP